MKNGGEKQQYCVYNFVQSNTHKIARKVCFHWS